MQILTISRRISFALLSLSFELAAHATSITPGTYNLADTSVSANGTAYSLTGNVTIDSNGLLTASDITLNDAALGNPVFDVISSTGGPAGYNPVADFAYVTTAGSTAQLYLSYLPALDGSGDILLCTVGGSCNSYQDSYGQVYGASAFGYNLVDLNAGGSLDAASVLPSAEIAPEPASLALLGTAIVGLAVALRIRRTKVMALKAPTAKG